MIQEFIVENDTDVEGNPTGGMAQATGLAIFWQNGPLGIGEGRVEPNGAFVETVLAIAKARLEFFQASPKFNCAENAGAIRHLDYALQYLDTRTSRRTQEGVEGTHGADRANRQDG